MASARAAALIGGLLAAAVLAGCGDGEKSLSVSASSAPRAVASTAAPDTSGTAVGTTAAPGPAPTTAPAPATADAATEPAPSASAPPTSARAAATTAPAPAPTSTTAHPTSTTSTSMLPAESGVPDVPRKNSQNEPITLDETALLACANNQIAWVAIQSGDGATASDYLGRAALRASASAVASVVDEAPALQQAAQTLDRGVVDGFLALCTTNGFEY